jgi:hypothetical protein
MPLHSFWGSDFSNVNGGVYGDRNPSDPTEVDFVSKEFGKRSFAYEVWEPKNFMESEVQVVNNEDPEMEFTTTHHWRYAR